MLIYSNLNTENINGKLGLLNLEKIHYFCSNSPKKYLEKGDDKDLANLKASLSNWYHSPFKVNSIVFDCVEQFMMYMKAVIFDPKNETSIADKILNTNDPKTMKRLGREIPNFDEEIWDKHKLNVVASGIYYKFSQNIPLFILLLNTRYSVLVEAADYDRIWGIGLKDKDAEKRVSEIKGKVKNLEDLDSIWEGHNYLGKCLMYVRNQHLENTVYV